MSSTPEKMFVIFKEEIRTYKTFMYFNGSIALITNSLAIYMILHKSPHQMKVYRWYLFNVIFWSALLDVYLGLIYQPFLMFPTIGVCGQGIVSHVDSFWFHLFLFQFHNFLMGVVGVSIMTAFLYRLAVVVHATKLMHKRKTLILIGLVHLFYSSPVAIFSLYAALYDSKQVSLDTKERFPVIYEFTHNMGCMFVSSTVTPISSIGFLCIAIFIFMLSGAIITTLIYLIMYKIKQEKYLMSSRTYAMEKQLLISLAIQFFVPTLSIAVPFSFQINLILFNKVDDRLGIKLAALFFIFTTWHSTLNASCMILLTRPYRHAFISMIFGCVCLKRPTMVIYTNETTMNALTNRSGNTLV